MNKDTNFKAIFFDMDGLLVDTEALRLTCSRDVLSTVGVEIPTEWYIKEGLANGRSTFELARAKGISESKIEQLRKYRNEQVGEIFRESIEPIDGVLETLENLYGRFLLAVVTGSRREHVDIIMQKTGMFRFFDFFITGDDVANFKPHPEPYLKAIQRAQEDAQQCLVLEDAQQGVRAAKAAGLTCYAIPDELTRTHDFSSADKILNSIRELPDIILPTTSDLS